MRTKFDIYVLITTTAWVDTSARGLLVHEGIVRPVFSASALTWFIRYMY